MTVTTTVHINSPAWLPDSSADHHQEATKGYDTIGTLHCSYGRQGPPKLRLTDLGLRGRTQQLSPS